MAEPTQPKIEPSPELLAAARIAYADPFSTEFWEEIVQRLGFEDAAEFPNEPELVEPLPRREP